MYRTKVLKKPRITMLGLEVEKWLNQQKEIEVINVSHSQSNDGFFTAMITYIDKKKIVIKEPNKIKVEVRGALNEN